MRECSIEGCKREHKGHGFCPTHLRRFKKWGDPLFVSVKRPPEGSIKEYYDNLLKSEEENCIEWPFNKSPKGYGIYKRKDATSDFVSRQLCEHFYGKPDPISLEAAHNCGNCRCVNPKHLRWATRKENHRDKVEHGTHGKKLNLDQIKQIREDKRSCAEIAEDYEVKKLAIYRIKTFKTWKDI